MRILVAIDGSPCSFAAVSEAAKFPWPAGTEIRIIMAEPPCSASVAGNLSPGAFDELMKAEQVEALKHLHNAVAVLAQSGAGVRVTSSFLKGPPKDVVVTTAEEWGADLVVVGSHGYGPVRRFFLGSVSSFVANNAPCSVQIVRGRQVESAAAPAAPHEDR